MITDGAPIELPEPAGAAGWREMYPAYLLMSEEISSWERRSYWFHDSLHHPGVKSPFDTVVCEALRLAKGQWTGRVFALPGGSGTEARIVNGYVYLSPVPVTDPAERARRAEVFAGRSSYYFEHWDDLYRRWRERVEELIASVGATPVPGLPVDYEPDSVFHAGAPGATTSRLLRSYDSLIEALFDAWQMHFEMLTLGYAAYYNVYGTAKRLFPDITDQAVAAMLTGHESIMQRPHHAISEMARFAADSGLAKIVTGSDYEAAVPALQKLPAGRDFLNRWDEEAADFANIATNGGLSHDSRSWRDDSSFVWHLLREHLSIPAQQASTVPAESGRLADKYAAMINDTKSRADFMAVIQIGRKVTQFVEDHSYYIENRFHLMFWDRMRSFAEMLVGQGFLTHSDKFFRLTRWEAGALIYEAAATWGTQAPSALRSRTHELVERRRRILTALGTINPPAHLGAPPDPGGDPAMRLLFGISGDQPPSGLAGQPASPGEVTGTARVVERELDLRRVRRGDILVARSVPIGWAGSFGVIGGLVTEIGGLLSHVGIVARELGLPAVVGVANICDLVRDGQLITIDGTTGVIRLLADN